MLSFDDRTMQTLTQLLDFIQNPDKYKALVTDLQSASAEYKKASSDLSDAKDIDAYHTKVMAGTQKAIDDVSAAQAAYDESIKVQSAQIADRISGLTERETEIAVKEQELKFREKGLKPKEDKLTSLADDLNTQKISLQALKDDLNMREQLLAQKAEQIKQLVGQ